MTHKSKISATNKKETTRLAHNWTKNGKWVLIDPLGLVGILGFKHHFSSSLVVNYYYFLELAHIADESG